ncbi:hypothetical protein Pcinc_021463 [Petrolisthes cinctipes]|uniref:Uncharacterized protein n=1 Tax=Petrolisthes cinctipes TaxID=88211 RepID=A0AAE1FFK3_PETCI|nr:hypothetical protein Pcinc_021463 [Petrolisthes cinctipes]
MLFDTMNTGDERPGTPLPFLGLSVTRCSPIVTEFERVNSLFQSTDAKPSRLLYELDTHFKALNRRVYSEDGSLLPMNRVDFGAKFTMECNKLLTDKEGADRRLTLQKRCHDMLRELVAQNLVLYVGGFGITSLVRVGNPGLRQEAQLPAGYDEGRTRAARLAGYLTYTRLGREYERLIQTYA